VNVRAADAAQWRRRADAAGPPLGFRPAGEAGALHGRTLCFARRPLVDVGPRGLGGGLRAAHASPRPHEEVEDIVVRPSVR